MTTEEVISLIKKYEKRINDCSKEERKISNEINDLEECYRKLNSVYKDYCNLIDRRKRNAKVIGALSGLRFIANVSKKWAVMLTGNSIIGSIEIIETSLKKVKNEICNKENQKKDIISQKNRYIEKKIYYKNKLNSLNY